MVAVIPSPFPEWTVQRSAAYMWPSHAGIDFSSRSGGVWEGDPIPASGSGTVTYSGRRWLGGANRERPGVAAGNAKVVLYDADAFGLGFPVQVRYCHLESLEGPGVGARVSRGQTVGLVGTTGASTAPHLHAEVWIGGSIQNPFDWVNLSEIAGGPQFAGGGLEPFEEDDMFTDEDRRKIDAIYARVPTIDQLNRRMVTEIEEVRKTKTLAGHARDAAREVLRRIKG